MKRVIILFGFLFLISLGFVSSGTYDYNSEYDMYCRTVDYYAQTGGWPCYRLQYFPDIEEYMMEENVGCFDVPGWIWAEEEYNCLINPNPGTGVESCYTYETQKKCLFDFYSAGGNGPISNFQKICCIDSECIEDSHCDSGEVCEEGVCIPEEPQCQPQTCEELNAECGEISDGCEGGNILNCGTCDTGFNCVDNTCIEIVPEPQGEAYWANMNNEPISSADIEDSVRLVIKDLEPNTDVSINISKVGGNSVWWNPFTWGSGDSFVGNIDSTTWRISESGTLYFNVSVDGNEFRSNDLIVSNVEDNAPPTIEIIHPSEGDKFKINTDITAKAVISDEDDELNMTWNLDGEKISLGDCREDNCSIVLNLGGQGTKYILASVKQVLRPGMVSDDIKIYVYKLGVNTFSSIIKPESRERITGPTEVDFDASPSFASYCTSDIDCEEGETCYVISPGDEPWNCYDLDKNNIGLPANGEKYNLLFNWTFSDGNIISGNWVEDYDSVVEFKKFFPAGSYTAKVRIGYDGDLVNGN